MSAVLFDLDGTLIDTAHDLGHALNLLRARYGKPALPFEKIRPVASHGSKGLLALGFGLDETDDRFETMVDEYLTLYASVLVRQPDFLPGIENLLLALTEAQVPWGIVTNKPRRFSEPLIQAVPFLSDYLVDYADCLLCGDDAPKPKPSPETLLMACSQLNVNPQEVIYVGDAERDVEAGRAAKMETVVALFGYLSDDDQPERWGADYLVSKAEEILPLVKC